MQKILKKKKELSEKVKLISTKGLTKHSIGNYSILNGVKKFLSDELPYRMPILQKPIACQKMVIHLLSLDSMDCSSRVIVNLSFLLLVRQLDKVANSVFRRTIPKVGFSNLKAIKVNSLLLGMAAIFMSKVKFAKFLISVNNF